MLRMVNLLTRMINFEATAGNVEEFMELIQSRILFPLLLFKFLIWENEFGRRVQRGELTEEESLINYHSPSQFTQLNQS